eukprot:gb/GECG01001007.1/.p1 GENE.gb/GECG01001007.1/~~gb/GECG01001007.1/.p1  ORF type:complete len:837 (+),score=79.38 gb/GECG01001007.1/:1-2511(+)
MVVVHKLYLVLGLALILTVSSAESTLQQGHEAPRGASSAPSMGNIVPKNMQNLSQWIRYSFERLPCFDHADLQGMSETEVQVAINDRAYTIREKRFWEGSVSWKEFFGLLEEVAGLVEKQMMDEKSWYDQDSRLPPNWDTRQFLQETHFTNLNARTSYRGRGKGSEEEEALLPFVQKLLLPQDAVVATFGDLHGSVHSLLRELAGLVDMGYLDDTFRIRDEWKAKFFMICLGDYVDRGAYGVEVFATLLRLKAANPENMFFSRGNHEDKPQNVMGTFYDELVGKFPRTSTDNLTKVFRFYDLLPMAIFVGQANSRTLAGEWAKNDPQYIQACHGGLEVGYAPLEFLVDGGSNMLYLRESDVRTQYSTIPSLLRQQWWNRFTEQRNLRKRFQKLFSDYGRVYESPPKYGRHWPQKPTKLDVSNGFMWSDFFVHDENEDLAYTPGRGFIFGKPITKAWFQENGIFAIIRAHQHNNLPTAGPMLNELRGHGGLYDNWQQSNIVYTFLSATECAGFNFHTDSFGLLYLEGSVGPSQWRLEHCRHSVLKQLVNVNGRWFRSPDQEAHSFRESLDAASWSSMSSIFQSFRPRVAHVCDPQQQHGIFFTCRPLAWGHQPPRLRQALITEASEQCERLRKRAASASAGSENQWKIDIVSPKHGSIVGSMAWSDSKRRWLNDNAGNRDYSLGELSWQYWESLMDFSHPLTRDAILQSYNASSKDAPTTSKNIVQPVTLVTQLTSPSLEGVSSIANVPANLGVIVHVYGVDLSKSSSLTSLPVMDFLQSSECVKSDTSTLRSTVSLSGIPPGYLLLADAELVECDSSKDLPSPVGDRACSVFGVTV